MDLKLHTLQHKRKYWEVVSYPNILRCHFVNKVKMKQGKVDRYKSRLVVDGSKHVSGIDYKYSFAPVVKYNTLRIFLAIAAVYSMQVHQLDVDLHASTPWGEHPSRPLHPTAQVFLWIALISTELEYTPA
jgi:hypothetical protein